MIRSLLICLLIIPTSALAKNICPENKLIEPDMFVPESHYNKANAVKAVDFLSEVVKEGKPSGEWINIPNALKMIDGYTRKKQCIDSGNLSPTSWKCSEFCLFMEGSFAFD